MENKEWKMKIQNKDEGKVFIPKYENSYKTNYLTLTLLFKEQQLLYTRNYFENVYKHKLQKPVIKMINLNNMLEIKIHPAHVQYTSDPTSIPNIQDIVLYKKDEVNEIILFLPQMKNSHHNLGNTYETKKNSSTTGKKDFSLSLLEYFPDNSYDYYIHKQNVSYIFSEIDLNLMLLFVELIYKMMKYFVHNIKLDHQALLDANLYIILINLGKIKQYLLSSNHKNNSIQYKEYIIKTLECIQVEKPTNIPYSKNVQIVSPITTSPMFNISTENQYKPLPKTGYHSFCSNFLKALATIYSISNLLSQTHKPKKTISLCKKNWYIQNIALGYLLRNVLVTININTLSLMRNLYFVIITRTAPNLCIDINFDLQNGIFMVYDTNSHSYFTETFNWNVNSSILNKLCSIYTPFLMPQKYSQVQQRKATAYTKLSPSDIDILKMSNNDIALEFEANDSTTSSCSYIDSESLISLKTKTSSISKSDKGSVETFIMDSKVLSRQGKVIYAEEAAGDTLFNNKINVISNMYDLHFLNRRVWLMNLYKQSMEIKASFNIFLMKFDCINETIFERLPPCEYGDVAEQCWGHISSQTTCKVFLKCLGKSLLHLFFGAKL